MCLPRSAAAETPSPSSPSWGSQDWQLVLEALMRWLSQPARGSREKMIYLVVAYVQSMSVQVPRKALAGSRHIAEL